MILMKNLMLNLFKQERNSLEDLRRRMYYIIQITIISLWMAVTTYLAHHASVATISQWTLLPIVWFYTWAWQSEIVYWEGIVWCGAWWQWRWLRLNRRKCRRRTVPAIWFIIIIPVTELGDRWGPSIDSSGFFFSLCRCLSEIISLFFCLSSFIWVSIEDMALLILLSFNAISESDSIPPVLLASAAPPGPVSATFPNLFVVSLGSLLALV